MIWAGQKCLDLNHQYRRLFFGLFEIQGYECENRSDASILSHKDGYNHVHLLKDFFLMLGEASSARCMLRDEPLLDLSHSLAKKTK